MSFFAELKRRNVVKVGVAYGVLAWLLTQVTDTVLPIFSAPLWVLQTLVFIIFLGFPIALFLAWAFELTPDGIKTQQAADDANLPASGIKPNMLMMLSLVLAIGLIALMH